jgi:hypothetical protein
MSNYKQTINKETMKKLLFVLVLGAFAACGGGESTSTSDSTSVTTDTTSATTGAMSTDTTGTGTMSTDTTTIAH